MILTTPAECIGFLALWVFFFVLYRDYCVDRYRQRLFSLRDDLFDFAADGNVSFDNDAYKVLRSMINGSIRYGHRVGAVYLLGMALIRDGNVSRKKLENRWNAGLSELPQEVSEHLKKVRAKMHAELFLQIVERSPLLLLPLFVLLIFAVLGLALSMYAGSKAKNWFRAKYNRIMERLDLSAWQEAHA